MNIELKNELIRIGKTTEGLSGQFYFGHPKNEDKYPYGLLSSVTGVDDEDQEDDYLEEYVQVTLYGEDYELLEASSEDLHGKLQHKEDDFNMTGYNVDQIYREFKKVTENDFIWQIVMQYVIQLTKI
ncbi:MAG TPA: hypothetical protein VHO03_05895 [Ignavibacteriales bacterium]|nr:hypothetical protein [Ignavibacteriales bacterium]